MSNRIQSKALAWLTVICLIFAGVASAAAQTTSISDFEALCPLMNMIASVAVIRNEEEPETIPSPDGWLSKFFVTTLFLLRDKADPSLGISDEMAADTEEQYAFLRKVFANEVTMLNSVVDTEDYDGYIGFLPIVAKTPTASSIIQIIGEIYWSDKPISQHSDAEHQQVRWVGHATFTFQRYEEAMNGFLLAAFSVNTELDMEQAAQSYGDESLFPEIFTISQFAQHDPSISSVQRCTIKELQSNIHKHRYVSEDGITSRWICSEEEQIDGLYWTEDQRPLGYDREEFDKMKCDIKEDHYHLYSIGSSFNEPRDSETYFPLKCGENAMDRFPYKTPIVLQISAEESEILNELYLMRIQDSLLFYDEIRDLGFVGESFMCLMIKVENKGNEFIISEILTNDIEEYMDEYQYADYYHVSYDIGYTPVVDKHVLRLKK